MTLLSPDGTVLYTRGELAALTGTGVPTLKNLHRGRVIGTRGKRRKQGTGHPNSYAFEDALRVLVSKELLKVGLQVASIQSLFDALETPPSTGKRWAWLRSGERRRLGAALVLVLGHPLGPKNPLAGSVYLTSAAEAVHWLQSKRTVIVIDIGALILELEERTGEQYGTSSAEEPVPDGQQH
jgi:hypothetical protein